MKVRSKSGTNCIRSLGVEGWCCVYPSMCMCNSYILSCVGVSGVG